MSVLQIMDASGHTTLEYTIDEKEALANAEAAFNEAIAQGRGVGFALNEGEKPRIIRDFEPETERIIVAAPLVGG